MNEIRDPQPAIIVAAAPTGAYKSRAEFPSLPEAADEIAEEAYRCMEAGAAMLHLHVRDDKGRHSLDAALYREAFAAVRNRCGDGLLIQATSEQAGVYDTTEQIDAIRSIDTDFISIALSEIIGGGSDRELERAAALFEELRGRGTSIQVILYNAEHVSTWKTLRETGLAPADPVPLLFVLGRYHKTRQSTPDDLLPFLNALPAKDPWMVCAFGDREIDCMRFAASRGGHARVGFENNTVRPDGSALDSTAESVSLTVDALRKDGYSIAGVKEARRAFGIV